MNIYTANEYIAIPGDKVMYYGGSPENGIMCPGRESVYLALQDAEALNAAAKLGTGSVVVGDIDAQAASWSSVFNLLNDLMPGFDRVASTGEQSALIAIRRLHEEWKRARETEAMERGLNAKRVQELKDALAMCIKPMERCGLTATADACRRVLFPELHRGDSPLSKPETGR